MDADALVCFAVKRGDVRERADVNYAPATQSLSALYAHPKFPLTPLRKVVQLAQYGISELATSDVTGLPMIRMNNLQAEGWDFTDLKYIELSPKDATRYLLEPGDILFNRTKLQRASRQMRSLSRTGCLGLCIVSRACSTRYDRRASRFRLPLSQYSGGASAD